MPRDPRDYRIVSTTPLSDYPLGIAFCLWCKNAVYQRSRYGRSRVWQGEAKRGRITFAEEMHVVTGPDGDRDACGACVQRLGIGQGEGDAPD